MSEINEGDLIGTGGHGKVYSRDHKHKKIAVKKIKLMNEHHIVNFENESFFLLKLKNAGCKYSIRAEKCYVKNDFGFIEMEQCVTDLYQILSNRTSKYLTEPQAAKLFYNILLAVKELHDLNIAHLDLKLENILLLNKNNLNKIKLCDFGSSSHFSHNERTMLYKKVGSPWYCAPELEYGCTPCLPDKADIWSLGIILHLLLIKHFPVLVPPAGPYIRKENITFSHILYYSPEVRDLIQLCLQYDPLLRPNIDQLLAHPWFACLKSKKSVNKFLPKLSKFVKTDARSTQ